MEETQTPLRARKPQPRHYYANPIGVGGYHLSFFVDKDTDEIGLELIISDNEDAYHELRAQTEELEVELGTEIYWEELRETHAGRMRSNLGVKRAADIENQSAWDEYYEWLLEQGDRFHEVFPERLRQL
ncbi:DUF4268 domain-containing protein [Haladaptatus sp. GCM10025707]|uniref:DUF4268 domain-containing protein n=1 Tax=unclassified Haladaptatus TaxID=2622732 RepID=UPI0023E7F229|nr:DUF4268 domain-containing protein [Haladaptatus sp. QDMS2]